MAEYLLDTNHTSAAICKVAPLRERIIQADRKGNVFGTCIPLLCELETGIVQTAEVADNRRRLTQLLKIVRLWPIDRELSILFGELAVELRQAGRMLSFVDVMLAAMARPKSLTLLTTDGDFRGVRGLKTKNWLK